MIHYNSPILVGDQVIEHVTVSLSAINQGLLTGVTKLRLKHRIDHFLGLVLTPGGT